MPDPMEYAVAELLREAGVDYIVDGDPGNQSGLDFYIPGWDTYIEVKQFWSPRISEQMQRAKNVIAIQGAGSIIVLRMMLERFAHRAAPEISRKI